MQQEKQQGDHQSWWQQPVFARVICLHILRLVNRLTIGVKAVQVQYDKAMFSATCFKRLVW